MLEGFLFLTPVERHGSYGNMQTSAQKFHSPILVFVLFFTFLFSTSAHSSQLIVGTIFVDGQDFYLNARLAAESQPRQIRIVARTEAVKDVLEKLSTGDFLSGGFEYDTNNRLYWLDTVESVGLRSLLGSWYEEGTLFRFESFNRLRVLSSVASLEGGIFSSRIYSKDFNYSLSPSSGDRAWIAFLSDRQSTYYSTLENFALSIRIKMYDADSGKLMKVHNLTRLNSGAVTPSPIAPICQ